MKNVTVVILMILSIGQSRYFLSQDGPKVVVFNSQEEETEDNEIYAKNLFKFGLLSPFAGDFSFYYERVLTRGFSVEAGLGITIEDYINAVIGEDAWSITSDNNLFGPSALIGFRYYPISTPEDFYVAGEFKFKRYRSEQFPNLNDAYVRSSSVSKFRLTFGYQLFVYKNVFWDFFGGFGLGTRTLVDYAPDLNDPSVIVKNEQKEITPSIHIGVKIGLTFNQN